MAAQSAKMMIIITTITMTQNQRFPRLPQSSSQEEDVFEQEDDEDDLEHEDLLSSELDDMLELCGQSLVSVLEELQSLDEDLG